MATKISVFNTLLETIGSELDLATERMAKTKKALDEAKKNGSMLDEYRKDYIDNLVKLMEKGLAKEIHNNYQNFLKKLDQAIAGQVEVIISADYEYKVERTIWQELQRKKLSYETLLKRKAKSEHHIALKADQKMMDEYAMRAKRPRVI